MYSPVLPGAALKIHVFSFYVILSKSKTSEWNTIVFVCCSPCMFSVRWQQWQTGGSIRLDCCSHAAAITCIALQQKLKLPAESQTRHCVTPCLHSSVVFDVWLHQSLLTAAYLSDGVCSCSFRCVLSVESRLSSARCLSLSVCLPLPPPPPLTFVLSMVGVSLLFLWCCFNPWLLPLHY